MSDRTTQPAVSRPRVAEGEVLITEQDNKFRRGLYTDHHDWIADEPESSGGTEQGPDPYALLLMALGSCTSMTLRMYANRKQLPVSDIRVWLRHSRVHARDCEDCESESGYVDRIEREIAYRGELEPEMRERFLEIADKCPVHKTLTGEIRVVTRYREDDG